MTIGKDNTRTEIILMKEAKTLRSNWNTIMNVNIPIATFKP